MKKNLLIIAPVGTRSGYGDHARDLFHSFNDLDMFNIKVSDVRWGDTPRNALNSSNEKDKKIIDCILKPGEQLKQQPDVCVDIRKNSPTFGKIYSKILNDKNNHSIYIPVGFAHGFCVLSDEAIFHYKCTDYYYPNDQYGILWNSIDFDWIVSNPIVSDKDKKLPNFLEQDKELLPNYE